jgi:hypothetical protein
MKLNIRKAVHTFYKALGLHEYALHFRKKL